MRVADLMSTDPTVLRPNATLAEAAEEMRLAQIRHLPVVNANGCVLGMLSHRDLVAASTKAKRHVRQAMVEDVMTISADTPAHEAAYLLLRHAIGSVPVVDDADRIVGIITETDFVRAAYTLLGGRVPIDQLIDEESEAEDV